MNTKTWVRSLSWEIYRQSMKINEIIETHLKAISIKQLSSQVPMRHMLETCRETKWMSISGADLIPSFEKSFQVSSWQIDPYTLGPHGSLATCFKSSYLRPGQVSRHKSWFWQWRSFQLHKPHWGLLGYSGSAGSTKKCVLSMWHSFLLIWNTLLGIQAYTSIVGHQCSYM